MSTGAWRALAGRERLPGCLAPGLALILAASAVACGPRHHEPAPHETADTRTGTGADAPAAPGLPTSDEPAPRTAAAEPAPPPVRDIVIITDRAALDALSQAGAELGTLLHGAPAASNRELASAPRYASMIPVLQSDLGAIAREDPDAGVGIRGHVHRLFDARWLDSPRARYELVGLTHRIDFIPARSDACGEIHLVYRLAYTTEVSGETVSSRLPMTLVVVLPGAPVDMDQGPEPCAHGARLWRVPAHLQGQELITHLVADTGPLNPRILHHTRVEAVRTNLQSVRWPSSVRPDLGGHAEYILRVFEASGQGMRPGLLENTPDVDRLRASRTLQRELHDWIARNLDAIEQGTARVPARFLATISVSVTPRGLSRRANRPYRQIFGARAFADIEASLKSRTLIGSPEALLRRLDDLSCAGCHQSRAIAGFHLLGDDGPDVAPGNALAVAMSPHLMDEIERRTMITAALAQDLPASFHRPFAERGPHDPGTLGSRCAFAAKDRPADPGFASWTCAPGFVCAAYDTPGDDTAVGTCVPDADMDVGGPCEFGPISPSPNPHRDRARNRPAHACAGGAVCNVNRTGFPGGMCTTTCANLPGSGTCGVIALLEPFNNCLARKTPFPRCLAEHVTPAGLRACDARTPCRDDYICARTPDGRGACIPPYFLFQMRVDGHP